MTDAKLLISALAGTKPAPSIIVEDQTTNDIIRQILRKHSQCEADYDRIAQFFEKKTLYKTCESLWKFCRENFNYVIEDEDYQYTSCPLTMLQKGAVDCKNYSLFCAGVLDGLKRLGWELNWVYRFASYDILTPTVGHVFVVVNPHTDDIWIDPVLDQFNYHEWYWYHKDRQVKTKKVVAGIGRIRRRRIGSAEDDLMSSIYEYWQGVTGAIQLSMTTKTLNSISQAVLQSASLAVPGIAEALAVVKGGSVVLNNAFGSGSIESRLWNDLSSPLGLLSINIFNDIFNGRTYNTDQYWAAVYYQFYVQGKNVTDINHVTDSDVPPALKWFIDRTLVFISGREHIIALTQSAAKYESYHGANPDTTTDRSLTAPASVVAQTYWSNVGNFDQSLRGSWANTVGVADTGLAQIAKSYGLTTEQYIHQTQTTNPVVQAPVVVTDQNNTWKVALIAAAALGFVIIGNS